MTDIQLGEQIRDSDRFNANHLVTIRFDLSQPHLPRIRRIGSLDYNVEFLVMPDCLEHFHRFRVRPAS